MILLVGKEAKVLVFQIVFSLTWNWKDPSDSEWRMISLLQCTGEALQGVVSSHSQVEACFTDVSLHPVDRLAGSCAKQIGIEQLDDI